MFIYILLAFIIASAAIKENGYVNRRSQHAFAFCLFIFLLVVGLRYNKGDYGTYEYGYNNNIDVGGDTGYYIIQCFFHNLGISFQLFVFLITLVSVFAFKKVFSLGSWRAFGMVIILGKFFTLYAMSGIRQYMAMFVCWLAIVELLNNNRKLLFIALVLLAYTLHGSAIIMLPVIFLRGFKFSYANGSFLLLLSFIIGLGSNQFFESISDFSDFIDFRFGSYYYDTLQGDGEAMNVLNYAENFLFLLFALIVRKKALKEFVYYDFFLYLFIIYCGFLIVGNEVGIVKRLRDYYAISYAFIVPYFPLLFSDKPFRKISKVIFIGYFVFLMFRSLSVYDSALSTDNHSRMVPYSSVFVLINK